MLDGLSIFQWRAEYRDMATEFTRYAQHRADCQSMDASHQHPNITREARATCNAVVCTCGLLPILACLMNDVEFVYMCPHRHLRSMPITPGMGIDKTDETCHTEGADDETE